VILLVSLRSQGRNVAAVRQPWTCTLEVRKLGAELERPLRAKRLPDASILLPTNLEGERVPGIPLESGDRGRVIGRRRQQQLAVDGDLRHRKDSRVVTLGRPSPRGG